MVAGLVDGRAGAYDDAARAAVYRVIRERRDVRRGYLPEPLPEELLGRLLAAAHDGPSVGLMQPSRFLVIRDLDVRRAVHGVFARANEAALAGYDGERREQYGALKLEGILEAPQNVCVVCESGSGRGHGLGRGTMPEAAVYSTVCAVENLWLAARSEGVAVGWVSILDPPALKEVLGIPECAMPVAYLCLGYVDRFGEGPELERVGWEQRMPLEEVVYRERYGRRAGEVEV